MGKVLHRYGCTSNCLHNSWSVNTFKLLMMLKLFYCKELLECHFNQLVALLVFTIILDRFHSLHLYSSVFLKQFFICGHVKDGAYKEAAPRSHCSHEQQFLTKNKPEQNKYCIINFFQRKFSTKCTIGLLLFPPV